MQEPNAEMYERILDEMYETDDALNMFEAIDSAIERLQLTNNMADPEDYAGLFRQLATDVSTGERGHVTK